MKISKALFDDPKAARNVAATMHEAPRESRAWLGWLFMGVMLGGSLMCVLDMYNERIERDERFSRMSGAKPDDNSPAMVPEGKAPSSKVTP